MLKNLRHMIEAAFIGIIFLIFRALPFHTASKVGGRIGRFVGPLLPVTKVAYKNLVLAMPELTKREQKVIIKGMWENLARVAVEFTHMGDVPTADIVEVEGKEHITFARRHPKTCLFFSGHLGNWELLPAVAAAKECPLMLVYRHANNPMVDKLIRDTRQTYQAGSIPKGKIGARKLIQHIKDGANIGLLVDQKMNDGIAVPFFCHDAMTAPAIANLALKYDCPIIPACVIRTKGARFKIKVYPPLEIEKTGNQEADIRAIMEKINQMLEAWIRENPSQWFWVHKRWKR